MKTDLRPEELSSLVDARHSRVVLFTTLSHLGRGQCGFAATLQHEWGSNLFISFQNSLDKRLLQQHNTRICVIAGLSIQQTKKHYM